MEKPTLKELKKVAKETGTWLWKFKNAFGIPLEECLATTIKEAKEAYYAAHGGSEAKQAALRKWIELCTTIDEVKDVSEDSEIQEEVLRKWIELCTSVKQVEEVSIAAPDNSESKQAALRKWIELCTTIDEVKDVYLATLDGSEAEHAALRRMYELLKAA